jgi:hypothetical protein
VIVAVTAALLVRRQIRRRRKAKTSLCGRAADCACGTTHVSYSEKITYKIKQGS